MVVRMKKFISILIGLSLCTALGISIYFNITAKNLILAAPVSKVTDIPVERLDEHKVSIKNIQVVLADGSYGNISLSFLVDSKKAAEELSKRNFQIKNYAIKNLSDIDSKTFLDPVGSQKVLEQIKIEINEQVQEGKVLEAYFIDKLVI